MKLRASLATFVVAVLCLPLFGATCADNVRPADLTYAAAVGEYAEPLVVDWTPGQRGDLEIAMHEGVAIMAVDPDTGGLKLLKNCRLDGEYGFIGMSHKQQLVRLQNADEIRVNLPLTGNQLAGDLEGELDQGASLDVALVMIGKKKTTWRAAKTSDLAGDCKGATHFVSGAMVGAFCMETGSQGRARTVAEVFGGGGGEVTLTSGKSVRNIDGDLTHCERARRSDGAPPERCSALIRIELVALSDAKPATPETAPVDTTPVATPGTTAPEPTLATTRVSEADACPRGFVWSDGKCTKPTRDVVYTCSPTDASACERQCNAGDGGSCLLRGQQVARKAKSNRDFALAAKFYRKACDLKEWRACADLGGLFYGGHGVTADKREAAKLFAVACDGGLASGCGALGRVFYLGDLGVSDHQKAVRFYAKGCKGGDHASCSDLGVLALGRGDETNATKLFKRACDGGSSYGCTNFGYMVEMGKSVPSDPKLAVELYKKGCEHADESCGSLALMTHMGRGLRRNDDEAIKLYERACRRWDVTSCSVLRVVFDYKVQIAPDSRRQLEHVWGPTCKSGSSRDCTQLGLLYVAEGDKSAGISKIEEGCRKGDAFGCFVIRYIPQ